MQGQAGPYAHQMPRCLSCGNIAPWQVEPLLLTHHIIITIVLLVLWGGGLVYLVIILLMRSSESNRGKICSHCGARNMFTFVYDDGMAPAPVQMQPQQPVASVGSGIPVVAQVASRPVPATVFSGNIAQARVIVDGRTVASLQLAPGTRYTLGRDPGNSVVINNPEVSAQHAEIEISSDGRMVLRDAGSTNGTTVNGAALDSARTLVEGDSVGMGAVNVRFQTT